MSLELIQKILDKNLTVKLEPYVTCSENGTLSFLELPIVLNDIKIGIAKSIHIHDKALERALEEEKSMLPPVDWEKRYYLTMKILKKLNPKIYYQVLDERDKGSE